MCVREEELVFAQLLSLAKARLGATRDAGGLSVVPVLGGTKEVPSYRLLPFMEQDDDICVEEIDADGEVAELSVRNHGATPLLVVEGQILVGGKQNRVAARSIIVRPHSAAILPVCCVEQGRWCFDPDEVSLHYSRIAPPSIRARSSSRREDTDDCDTDEDVQQSVWRVAAACLQETGTDSATASVAACHESADEGDPRPNLEAIALPKTTRGVVVFDGDTPLSVEVFDHAATFAVLWPQIVSGLAVDGRRGNRSGRQPRGRSGAVQSRARAFLQQALRSLEVTKDGHGAAGVAVAAHAKGLSGGGEVYCGRLCHVAVHSAQR